MRARDAAPRRKDTFSPCDCFSYALAKALGEPLLYKGSDFAQTDVIAFSVE